MVIVIVTDFLAFVLMHTQKNESQEYQIFGGKFWRKIGVCVYTFLYVNKKILNFLNIKEHPAKKHIDRKLIFRIRMFYVIGILLTGLMLYEVLDGFIGIELALGGFLLGLFLGFIATRMFIIHWQLEFMEEPIQVNIEKKVLE